MSKITPDGIAFLARELSDGSRKNTADGRATMTPEQARRRIEGAVTRADHKKQ